MIQKKLYAGTGDRKTPLKIQNLLQNYIKILNERNYMLRTGSESGTQTFMKTLADKVEVMDIPEANHLVYAANRSHYVLWSHNGNRVKKKYARDTLILLGDNLATPPEFLLCWCNINIKGGSVFSIRLAKEHNIPIYNIFREDHQEKFEEEILGL